MKNVYKTVLVTALLVTTSMVTRLTAQSKWNRTDPYPVATAGNPMAPFTATHDCEPEQTVRISLSGYRQIADTVGGCSSTCSAATAGAEVTCTSPCTSNDYEIGDMFGRWNFVAPFYAEANGSTEVADKLITTLKLTDPTGTGYTAQELAECITKFELPRNTDPDKNFGFASVPVCYTKYGIRLDFEMAPECSNFGGVFRFGVAQARQKPEFRDQTSSATPETKYSAICKDVVANWIVKQRDLMAETLDLDLGPYCDSGIDMSDLGIYWRHSFDLSNPETCYNSDYPHSTFTPYLMGECCFPFSKQRPLWQLFSVPFGNNGPWGYGVTGGFTMNFLETIDFGVDVGMTRFSEETYSNCPVPTNEYETGIFTRKADLAIKPGTNWTFGAAMHAYHFWYNFSASLDLRLIHHCHDHYTILATRPLSWETDFPKTNIDLDRLVDTSCWDSSFASFGLTYDVSSEINLGFFCQLPMRQRFSYRSTTVMGSLTFAF